VQLIGTLDASVLPCESRRCGVQQEHKYAAGKINQISFDNTARRNATFRTMEDRQAITLDL
jgi:hypothetical protein